MFVASLQRGLRSNSNKLMGKTENGIYSSSFSRLCEIENDKMGRLELFQVGDSCEMSEKTEDI